MISTQSISYQYPQNNPQSEANKLLSFPDISCRRGETLCILGRSGCGKTTLLHLLGGLLRPASGTISIDGQDINQLSEGQLDQFRGAKIGVIFQQSHLIKSLTVAQNLLTAQYLSNTKQDIEQIAALLGKLNLGSKLHSPANQLSVGEQQRVAIARALINSPALILADEPTSSLDDHNCEEVIGLLQQQAAAHNSALVVVTHDARLKSQISQQLVLSPLV